MMDIARETRPDPSEERSMAVRQEILATAPGGWSWRICAGFDAAGIPRILEANPSSGATFCSDRGQTALARGMSGQGDSRAA